MILCYSHNSPDEKYLTSIGSVYMAVENLNIAAVAEGLGGCTMGASGPHWAHRVRAGRGVGW